MAGIILIIQMGKLRSRKAKRPPEAAQGMVEGPGFEFPA